MTDMPHVRIPVDQVTLAEASDLVDDGGAFWRDTMPAILRHYGGIGIAEYWDLTVGDHRRLLDWLIAEGAIDRKLGEG